MQNNFDKARKAFNAACDKYKLTAEAVSAPKAETRKDDWDCVSWEVSYKVKGREFQRSKYSQGLGNFKVDALTLRLHSSLGRGVEGMQWHKYKRPLEAEGVPALYELIDRKQGCDLEGALSCIVRDCWTSLERQSFECFCADYGYDSDSTSTRAKETYEAIRESGDALIRAIGEDAAHELHALSCEL